VDHHRTGIKERHIAAADEYTSDLGAEAARRAMKWPASPPSKLI